MKRCGSPLIQYSHIQPRVFAHLPEKSRPRQLSKSPKPNKFKAPTLNSIGKDERQSKYILNSWKSNKNFTSRFKNNLVSNTTPGAKIKSTCNSAIHSSPGSVINNSRWSSKKSNSKFGFSNKQYRKLQIIKTSRLINLKLIVSLNRMKYSKFYQNVLKAFLECLNISHKREAVNLEEWEEIILYINRNQSKILNSIANISDLVEKEDFEKLSLWESRK